MKKRGGSTLLYFILIDIAIIIMMGVALWAFVGGKLNDDDFWKNYYAKDTAMILDTMSGEGDLRIEYGVWQGKRLFEFDFLDSRVKTYIYRDDIPKENRLPATRIWGKPETYIFEETTLIPTVFFFEKQGNRMFINETGTSLTACPSIDTRDYLGQKKLYFEAFSDDGEAKKIVEHLKTRLRQENTKKHEADVVIVLGFSAEEQNFLRIHYPSQNVLKNQKMGCLIENNFARYFPEYFDAIIVESGPVDSSKENSLYIEMGSTKFLDDKIKDEIINFANAIHGGIYAYYE